MTEQELIAKQALRIANLEEELAHAVDACSKIHLICVGIGGPLNDNKMGYTGPQKTDFESINRYASSVCFI